MNVTLRTMLVACSALGSLAGLLIVATPQERFIVALIGAAAPVTVYGLAKLMRPVLTCARNRNWLQFSVRGLLLFSAFCALVSFIWANFLQAIYEQQRFCAVVASLGGSSYVDSSDFRISLGGQHITDDVLASLATMPGRRNVTQLSISRSPSITDAGMMRLKEFPTVSIVSVTECGQITDKGAKELQAITTLRGVFLFGCPNVTDDGVAWLANRRELKIIHVMNTQVTPATLEELKSSLPYCDVVRNTP